MANSQTATDSVMPARVRRGWLAVPSWLLSVVLHSLLLIGLGIWLPNRSLWGPTAVTDRDVDIYSLGPGSANIDFEAATQSKILSDTNVVVTKPQTANELFGLEDALPVPLSLPNGFADRIGPGPAVPATAGAGTTGSLKPSGIASGGALGVIGKGRTSFFGGYVTGTRFIYVVDCSGSMSNHNAMGAAKAELMASLEKLDETQQFQIIFYNDRQHLMPTSAGKNGLMFVTEANRALAGQYVRSIQPDRGTEHFEAIKLALDFKPEVIFFLTDATEPRLDGADLEKIRRQNSGRTQIHTVQFDVGESLNDDNFLRKLARQNDGTFTYRDITQFNRARE